MKPLSPHDPLDDLIAAALHGELTPEERTQFEVRLSNDPAAQAAYQEAQAMHDLLEKTHKNAQPDSAFEQRMVSGVRRKIQTEQHRETAWESLVALWTGFRKIVGGRSMWTYGGVCSVVLVLFLSFVIYSGNQVKGVFTTISSQLAIAGSAGETPTQILNLNATTEEKKNLRQLVKQQGINYTETAKRGLSLSGYVDNSYTQQFGGTGSGFASGSSGSISGTGSLTRSGSGTVLLNGANTYTGGVTVSGGTLTTSGNVDRNGFAAGTQTFNGATSISSGTLNVGQTTAHAPIPGATASIGNTTIAATSTYTMSAGDYVEAPSVPAATPDTSAQGPAPSVTTQNGILKSDEAAKELPSPAATTPPGELATAWDSNWKAPAKPAEAPAVDDRKLIRNAQLDLEVKSYQAAMDQITALTKAAGGYVDTSNSQKGGNGKLQGTVVVKVLPQNLDAFLLKLRDLGQVNNQSVSTDDVTKDYFDTQARLDNSRRMEEQLQELLKHANSKVADLLQVERELGRVRGEIEQMQGQLKLYDFQVQYATVTMQMKEKDLNQAAAYLLKEQDDFSLFATDVEGTFQKARQAADDFKAQVLTATLNHNSGSDVSAELVVMVAPDQIESFLGQVRSLGRVANFTRQTQRVAKDGGDSDQPADQTLTEKDKVQVHLAIRSDDETRKQVALTVVAKTVDDALDQAKTAALASAGVEILSSSLNKTPEGASTAQLTVRVPGKDYSSVIDGFKALGRTASLSIQRNDNSGPGANGDDAPVIVSLSLTDDDTPLQQTQMTILATDIDNQAQQIKQAAATSGVEVKASSFERQPDGTELAQLTFRLPMAKYAGFMDSLNKLGKVESLTVHRDDRPDQTRADDTAPVEINLQMHNQGDIVTADNGLLATLRQTFGEGAGALFGSVRVIGVVIAFLVPWAFTLGLLAWTGRRIYIWRKK